MPDCFEPKIGALPKAQQDIWTKLSPAPRLSFVLYGGTAVALYLGHRVSVDFDFFRSSPLDKNEVESTFAFMRDARTIQESENTLVVDVPMPSGAVKVSFFGGVTFGRINQPRQTKDFGISQAALYCATVPSR
jgi:Nucleotidyl transferase AbiEii toxin, Type IV TA system